MATTIGNYDVKKSQLSTEFPFIWLRGLNL